jgi:hypothetical protein
VFNRIKVVYETEIYDDMTGNYIPSEENISYNVFNFSGMLDIKPVRAEKSNLVLRAGLNYLFGSIADKIENDPSYDVDSDLWKLGFVGGLGIEHFVTDQFQST